MRRDMAEYGKEQGKARRAAMINGSQIVQLRTNPQPIFQAKRRQCKPRPAVSERHQVGE